MPCLFLGTVNMKLKFNVNLPNVGKDYICAVKPMYVYIHVLLRLPERAFQPQTWQFLWDGGLRYDPDIKLRENTGRLFENTNVNNF